jgi:hypothetical protein
MNAEGVREFQPRVARASALPWVTTKTFVATLKGLTSQGSLTQTPVEFQESRPVGIHGVLIRSCKVSVRARDSLSS